MTTTTKPQYRRSQSGQWVVFGPASAVQIGAVTVAKKDGTTKTEQVVALGKTFRVDGVECVYGYLAERESAGSGWVTEKGRNGRTYRHGDEITRCYHGHTSPKSGCESCFDVFDF